MGSEGAIDTHSSHAVNISMISVLLRASASRREKRSHSCFSTRPLPVTSSARKRARRSCTHTAKGAQGYKNVIPTDGVGAHVHSSGGEEVRGLWEFTGVPLIVVQKLQQRGAGTACGTHLFCMLADFALPAKLAELSKVKRLVCWLFLGGSIELGGIVSHCCPERLLPPQSRASASA